MSFGAGLGENEDSELTADSPPSSSSPPEKHHEPPEHSLSQTHLLGASLLLATVEVAAATENCMRGQGIVEGCVGPHGWAVAAGAMCSILGMMSIYGNNL